MRVTNATEQVGRNKINNSNNKTKRQPVETGKHKEISSDNQLNVNTVRRQDTID